MIHNFENDSDTITCIIDDVTGLDVQVNVKCEYDPGQPFKAANRSDPIGDPFMPATVEISKTSVYVGVVAGEDEFLTLNTDPDQTAEIEQAIIDYRNEEDR